MRVTWRYDISVVTHAEKLPCEIVEMILHASVHHRACPHAENDRHVQATFLGQLGIAHTGDMSGTDCDLSCDPSLDQLLFQAFGNFLSGFACSFQTVVYLLADEIT